MKKKGSKKNKGSDRLDFIRPRETTRLLRAREGRAAEFIKRLRIWLPLLSGAVVVTLFLWPALIPGFELSNISKNIPDLVIDNLTYTGVDDKNQTYSLMAAQATKPAALKGIYDMTKPEGEITLQDGSWVDGKADYGRYDEAGKHLWLGGNVQVFHDKGYQMTTDEMQVNLSTNEAWGEKNVLIQGGFGTVRGAGFRFLDSGNTLVISGPAKAILSLHESSGSDKPELVQPAMTSPKE